MSARHAPPFRFVDRVLERGADRCVVLTLVGGTAASRGTGAPERAELPLPLVIEAMAQAALPLLEADPDGRSGDRTGAGAAPGLLVGFDGARLLGPVRPGDRLKITAQIVARLGDLIRFRGHAEIDAVRVAEAEFTVVSGAAADGIR
ncbi:MAG TPA: hypothetical protein VGA64_08950 [Candidatus Polarisedimenticolia bacterium]